MTQWIVSSSSRIVKRPKMAVYTLIIVVLVAAIAVGCTFTGGKNSDTDIGDNITENTGNAENNGEKEKLPDTIFGTPLTEDELTYFTELFTHVNAEKEEDINWYNMILSCGLDYGDRRGFAVPEDVNLGTLFNNGFQNVSSVDNWTQEELAFIQGFHPGYPENAKDIYRLPAEKMNKVLQEYFGISLEQSNKVWLDKMNYFADTNCYFSSPAGAVGERGFEMVDGKRADDGTVYLLCRKQTRIVVTYTTDYLLLLRLTPNPGNENIPYRVYSCEEITP